MGLRSLCKDFNVLLSRRVMLLWNTNRTRRRYHQTLYNRGEIAIKIEGATAKFFLETHGDFVHLAGDYFEREQITTFVGLLRPDDVIYEVGGHIGTWSVFMAKKVHQGRVIVFEPQPENRARLEQNTAKNGLTNVQVLDAAVSDRAGHAQLGVREEHHDGRHSLMVDGNHTQTIRVPTMTLDQVAGERSMPPATVVKIDCEGGEHGVLGGMSGLLNSGSIRLVFAELHPAILDRAGVCPQQIENMLEAAGLRAIKRWNRAGEISLILQRQ